MRLTAVVYLILHCVTSSRGNDVCKTSSEDIDQTCPTDCSQNDTQVQGDSSVFRCSIGGIDDIRRYKSFKPAYFQPDTELIFEAPILLDIEFYRRRYRNFADKLTGNPSLGIRFLIPKGVEPKHSHGILFPEAVLMKFESISDEKHKDWFYYHCPRYRIFRFDDYSPHSSYEALNPRNISFDCLVGLNDTASYQLRVYMITLETVRGESATYVVTVNVVADLLAPVHWQTVIAVHVNEKRHTIYVVFQKLLKPLVKGYVVELCSGEEKIQTQKLPPMNNTALFKDVGVGTYYVKVSVKSKTCPTDSACMTTTSYIIDMPGPLDSVRYADFREDHLKIVAMVLGCLSGILFVLFLFGWGWFRLHRIKEEPVRGFIIHPFKHGTEQYNVIEKFTESLEDMCRCSIQRMMPEEWDDMTDKTVIEDWCENTLDKHVKFVVYVLSDRDLTDNNDFTYKNFYTCAIKTAVERKTSNKGLRIFAISFPFSKSKSFPLLNDCKVFKLMDEFFEICTEIKNLNHHTHSADEPLLQYKNDTVKALNQALEKVKSKHMAVDKDRSKPPKFIVKVDNDHPQKVSSGPQTIAGLNSDSNPNCDVDMINIKIPHNDNSYKESSARKDLFNLAKDLNPSSSSDDESISDTDTMDSVDNDKRYVDDGYVTEEMLNGGKDITGQTTLKCSLSKEGHEQHNEKIPLTNGYLPHETLNTSLQLKDPIVKPKLLEKGQNKNEDKTSGKALSNSGRKLDGLRCTSKHTVSDKDNLDYVHVTDCGTFKYDPATHRDRGGGDLKFKGSPTHYVANTPLAGRNEVLSSNIHLKHHFPQHLEPHSTLNLEPHYTQHLEPHAIRHTDPHSNKLLEPPSASITSHNGFNWPSSPAPNYPIPQAYVKNNQIHVDNQHSYHPMPRIPDPRNVDPEIKDFNSHLNDNSTNYLRQGFPDNSTHLDIGKLNNGGQMYVSHSSNQLNNQFTSLSDNCPRFQQANHSYVSSTQYPYMQHPNAHERLTYFNGAGSQQQNLQTDSLQPCSHAHYPKQYLQPGSQHLYSRTGSQQSQTGDQQPYSQTGLDMQGLKTNNTVHCNLASNDILSPDTSLDYETSFSEPAYSYNVPYNMLGTESGGSGYVTNILDKQRSESASTLTDKEISFAAVDPTVVEQSSVTLNDNKTNEDYESFNPIPPEEDTSPYGSMSDVMERLVRYN